MPDETHDDKGEPTANDEVSDIVDTNEHDASVRMWEELSQVLRSDDFGKNVTQWIQAWKDRKAPEIERQTKLDRDDMQVRRWSVVSRGLLSALVLVLATLLGWQGRLSGEAVAGLFGAFAGYLWAQRNGGGEVRP